MVQPRSAVAEHNLAGALGDLQRFAEYEAATQRAFAKGLDAPETWLVRARALQGLGELDAAEGAVTWLAASQSDSSSWLTTQFLTGQSAMMYMGTWLLASINDPTQNTQGNNIGFMPFPAVTGGKGSINQYPANVGSPSVINAKAYGPAGEAWLKCIAQNYGSASLKDQGTFSGFKINTPVKNLPPLTADVQSIINKTGSGVLWFEAYFNQKANADASANAAPLVTGQMSAQQYMSILQTDQDTGGS